MLAQVADRLLGAWWPAPRPRPANTAAALAPWEIGCAPRPAPR